MPPKPCLFICTTMEEIWKDVIGYEGLYQVSNYGNIKGLERVCGHYKGGLRTYKERMLSRTLHKDGYLKVGLTKDSQLRQFSIHRLVCEAFLENKENKPHVNHINGIKTDNRLENLEWVTCSENLSHAFRIGLRSQNGEKNHRATLTEDQVFQIKYSLNHLNNKDVAIIFSIKANEVARIRRGERWKHI